MSKAKSVARLEARINVDTLALLKRAAEIQGRSLTDFVVSAARDAAHRTIEETQVIRLPVEDQKRFVEALLKPSRTYARAPARVPAPQGTARSVTTL